MKAIREQLMRIVQVAPGFRNSWESFLSEWEPEGEPPWYIAMSELAHYIVDCYAQDSTTEFPKLFSTIEELLPNPDPKVESLIAMGLFEDIQNIASRREFGASPFRQQLGARSLVIWDEVDSGTKRVAEWAEKQKPKWWQFWRRRRVFDVEKALSQVESPELRKIMESDFRKRP